MGFIFGGNTGETAESIARKRAVADAMILRSLRRAPQNVGEGLNAIGEAIAARYMGRQADKGQAKGESDWQNTFGSALGMGGATAEPKKSGGIAGFFGYTPKVPPLSQTNPLAAHRPGQTGAGMPEVSSSGNIPPVDISGNKETFVSSLLPAAMEESKRTGVDPRIIVAQAAQETGWGKSAPGNNFFGIKSHGKGGGQNLTTHEVIKGQRVKINDNFRTFESPEDSVRGYGDFILNNPRYGKLRSAQGIDNQLAELQASGYATDPNYSRSVGAIARGIQLPEQQPQTGLEAIESIAPINGFAPTQNAPQPAMQPEQPSMVSRTGAITQQNFNERFGPAPTQANPVTAQPQPSPQPETDVPLAFQGSRQLMNARGGLADVLLGRSPSTATLFQDQPTTPQPSQAPQPAQAESKPDLNYLIRARSSPFIPESMKPVLDQMIETQRQEQQAAKEGQAWRARQDYETQQKQNDPAYQMGLKKTELELKDLETPDARPMSAEDRAKWGIPETDNRPYAMTEKGPTLIGGGGQTINIGGEVEVRKRLAAEMGLSPDDPRYQPYVLTGKFPREDAQSLTATDKKAILEADEMVSSAEGTLPLLARALELNDKAYSGIGAGTRAWLGGAIGMDNAEATLEFDNVVTGQALGQLRSIFGGNPTEGERKILMDISGSSGLPVEVRKNVLTRAQEAVDRRLGLYRERANELRGGTFYKPDGAGDPPKDVPVAKGGRLAASEGDSIPQGVDPQVWQHMTPEERRLWQ